MRRRAVFKRGYRWDITLLGESAPIVCVRAQNATMAERCAAEALGVPQSRLIASRTLSGARARREQKGKV